MKKSAFLFACATPLAMAWSLPALGQAPGQDTAGVTAMDGGTATDGGTGQEAAQTGEIIVMARKRQESVLKVPVVETVLSTETLAKAQVVDIRGVVNLVPGLNIGNNVLTVGTQIALRGVGTSSLDAGVDQSVSLNIDGLQLTQGATFGIGLFDMAQVEVLKGPQALFFGKNSPGGVIAIRTADPGGELEVIARSVYGFEDHQKRGELVVSAPLGDTLGVRVAGMYQEDDGYFFNRAVALPGTGARNPSTVRYNGGYEYILRGTVVWKPTDSFHARLKVNNSVKDVIGGGAPLGSCPDGIGAPAGIQFISPNENCKVDRTLYIVDIDPAAFPQARNNGVPFVHYVTNLDTLELGYDFNDHLALTSTTGFFHTKVDGLLNGANSGFAGATLIADNHFKRRDLTQELRLDSDFDSPLNFLVGAYYQDANIYNRVFVGGNTVYRLPATLTAGINDVDIRAYSGFGQLRYKLVPQLEITAGARYTDERRHDDVSRLTGIGATPTPTAILRPTLRSKNWSPELTITYTPTDNFTVFGALKQGYKSGSFTITSPPPAALTAAQIAAGQGLADISFGDERVRGGEVGIKARTADRALNVNAAFYYYKYQGLQVGANEVAAGGIPVIRTINAASSKVYGVDFDMSYRPPSIDGLSLRLGVNWNHARFEKFDNAQCIGGQTQADGCNLLLNPATGRFNAQDLSGLRLPKAADWTANGGIDYELPVGDSTKLNLGVNGQYSSRYLRDLGRRADFYQPSFFKFGGNIALAANDDAWEVALIGNNLSNKFTSGNCTNFSAATGQILLSPTTGGTTRNAAGIDELACIPDRGREVFLRLTLRPTSW